MEQEDDDFNLAYEATVLDGIEKLQKVADDAFGEMVYNEFTTSTYHGALSGHSEIVRAVDELIDGLWDAVLGEAVPQDELPLQGDDK